VHGRRDADSEKKPRTCWSRSMACCPEGVTAKELSLPNHREIGIRPGGPAYVIDFAGERFRAFRWKARMERSCN